MRHKLVLILLAILSSNCNGRAWRKRGALGPKAGPTGSSGDDDEDVNVHAGGISPAIGRRLMRSSNVCCDSDEDGCRSPDPPRGVPEGYLAVYAGPELRRFIIPTTYLRDPLFKLLLEKVEEEFGFDHGGGLTIPCEIETFKYLLKCMENNQKHQHSPANHHLNTGFASKYSAHRNQSRL